VREVPLHEAGDEESNRYGRDDPRRAARPGLAARFGLKGRITLRFQLLVHSFVVSKQAVVESQGMEARSGPSNSRALHLAI
jgi:hypothetical protein